MDTSWEQGQAGKDGLNLVLPTIGGSGKSVAPSMLYKPLVVEAALPNVFARKKSIWPHGQPWHRLNLIFFC